MCAMQGNKKHIQSNPSIESMRTRWIKKKDNIKSKQFNNKVFIPKLFCISNFDIKIIRDIINNVSKDIVKKIIHIKNNQYVIILNHKKDFSINSKGYNFIQGILIAKKQKNIYKLKHNDKFIYITFHKNIKINHKNMIYFENTIIGLKTTNFL